ncbi:MAG: hypothetical protein LIO41_01665 [Ruminococcus sp.]|nr:hypothetical protein [Ruminococcus sp.]
MKRISLFVCLLLITSCLSGCAPKSPQKIAVVHAVGIDSSEDGFEVSFQIFRASSSGSQTPIDPSQTNVEVISSTAKTIENAVQKCETQIGKTLFFGHNQLLVISEDIEDLYSCFSFFCLCQRFINKYGCRRNRRQGERYYKLRHFKRYSRRRNYEGNF